MRKGFQKHWINCLNFPRGNEEGFSFTSFNEVFLAESFPHICNNYPDYGIILFLHFHVEVFGYEVFAGNYCCFAFCDYGVWSYLCNELSRRVQRT